MTISVTALEALQSHWALDAIGPEERAHASDLVNERLARRAVGRQIDFAFKEHNSDVPLLERVALAYEMAAIEGLDALSRASGGDDVLRDQAAAASHNAFDIRRLFPIPEDTQERIYYVLQISALAYCGDRWSDLRRWYKENEVALVAPSVADAPWDKRILYRLFNCWVRLFRKKGWDDLDRIREIIAGLREDQKSHEAARLRERFTSRRSCRCAPIDRALSLGQGYGSSCGIYASRPAAVCLYATRQAFRGWDQCGNRLW